MEVGRRDGYITNCTPTLGVKTKALPALLRAKDNSLVMEMAKNCPGQRAGRQ